jgi:hypothetical protein
MLNNITRKYKQMIILAVAAAAIAAYVIPFNSGGVAPTQATSLYEDLIEGLNEDQARTNERLDEVIEANPDQADRVEDRRALSDERYDIARDRVADSRAGEVEENNLEANDASTEGAGTEGAGTEGAGTEGAGTEDTGSSTESLESTEADGGQDTGDRGNGNTNADNGRSDRTSNR